MTGAKEIKCEGEATSVLEKIPLPMDSVEGFQEFTAAGTVEVDNEHPEAKEKAGVSEGWCTRYTRWIPTSPALLEDAEKKILSYIKTFYTGKYVDIGTKEVSAKSRWSSWLCSPEERKLWTVAFNENTNANINENKHPLLLVHGLCASVGLWALNIDALAAERSVYAIDLLGFGRSSRPKFSSDPLEAESQHVEAIEAWRKKMDIEKFVLLGHSMGGFISASYAIKYPERVSHLVLADPWGFPDKPQKIEDVLPATKSTKVKVITTIGQKLNPLALIRAAGPMGPALIGRARPDLVLKFDALNQNGNADVSSYIYHSNAQSPTGEEAFRTMMDFFGWAKNPMRHRIHELKSDIPLTMIYGEKTWLPNVPEAEIKELRSPDAYVKVYTIAEAGHHVYVDNQSLFNSIVNKAAELADKLFGKPSPSISTESENNVTA